MDSVEQKLVDFISLYSNGNLKDDEKDLFEDVCLFYSASKMLLLGSQDQHTLIIAGHLIQKATKIVDSF